MILLKDAWRRKTLSSDTPALRQINAAEVNLVADVRARAAIIPVWPHVEDQQRHRNGKYAVTRGIKRALGNTVFPAGSYLMQKTLSFFNTSRACSIDFTQFVPMFCVDAARYRSAIS